MINGLGVLGWGVGGIEAEAAMLGQPISMLMPEVIGFKLTGKMKEGVDRHRPRADGRADAAPEGRGRQVRRILRRRPRSPDARRPRHHRQHGAGIRRDLRLLPDRRETLNYLHHDRPRRPTASRWSRPMPRPRACGATGVSAAGLHRHAGTRPRLRRAVDGRPEASAGRPLPLDIGFGFREALEAEYKKPGRTRPPSGRRRGLHDLGHGDVAIAAITSCTNTSNPSVLIGAGLVARKAVEKGLTASPG
jgi:aconitate hydratase